MQQPKGIFVIMPFSTTPSCSTEQWTEIYQHVFRPAAEACGYSCDRAQPRVGSLIGSIIDQLHRSWIVLADVTDNNPNVFYELGVRHSLSRRTIILAQHDRYISSDLRGYWWLTYGTSPAQVRKLQEDLRRITGEIEAEPDRSDSPVSDYFQKQFVTVDSRSRTETLKKLSGLYTELTGNELAVQQLASGGPSAGSWIRRVWPFRRPAGRGGQHLPPEAYIAHDCLRLLLNTLYVDLGPGLLKSCYELWYDLRRVETGMRGGVFLTGLLASLVSVKQAVHDVKGKVAAGEYEEPETISTMAWEASERLSSPPDRGVGHDRDNSTCARCHRQIPAGARVCASCGDTWSGRCPRCGVDTGRSKYCPGCGSAC